MNVHGARVQLAEMRSCQTCQMPVAGRRAARHRSIKVFKRAGDPPSSTIDYKTEVKCCTTSLSCKFDITGFFQWAQIIHRPLTLNGANPEGGNQLDIKNQSHHLNGAEITITMLLPSVVRLQFLFRLWRCLCTEMHGRTAHLSLIHI